MLKKGIAHRMESKKYKQSENVVKQVHPERQS